MKITIKVQAEDQQLEEDMVIQDTENYNYVAVHIRGCWYDIPIADLYRATMPFMDLRHEGMSDEV